MPFIVSVAIENVSVDSEIFFFKYVECLYLLMIFSFLSLDKDLMPFQWCCVQSSFCHLYLAKRPLDRCQGYGWTRSDPSIPESTGAPGLGEKYWYTKTNI